MERFQLFMLILVGLLGIAGIIIGMLALNKKDDVFDGNVTNEDGETVKIKDYLQSPDGIRTLNSVIGSSKSVTDLMNTLTSGLEQIKNDVDTINNEKIPKSIPYYAYGDEQDIWGDCVCPIN